MWVGGSKSRWDCKAGEGVYRERGSQRSREGVRNGRNDGKGSRMERVREMVSEMQRGREGGRQMDWERERE